MSQLKWTELGPSKPRSTPKSATADHRPDRFQVPNAALYRADRDFLDFLSPAHDEGWKLHAVAPDSYALHEGYRRVFQYLQVKKVPHKFVSKPTAMVNMERAGQSGKFLTVYPRGEEQMLRLVEVIESLLNARQPFTFSKTPHGDRPVGGLGVLSARYGGLTGPYVLTAAAWLDAGSDWTAAACYALDDRTRYKPDHIFDPFDRRLPGVAGWVVYPVLFRPHSKNIKQFRTAPRAVPGKVYDRQTGAFVTAWVQGVKPQGVPRGPLPPRPGPMGINDEH